MAANDFTGVPRMIPWHRPELRAAREELLLQMGQLEAVEEEAMRSVVAATANDPAYLRFRRRLLQEVLRALPRQAKKGQRGKAA